MKLNIVGYDYEVIFEPNQIHDGKEYVWGLCDNEKQTLQIWAGLTEQRQRQVVIHEIFHAIDEIFAVQHDSHEEKTCDCHGQGWWLVLRDNPELVRWLVAEDQEQFRKMVDAGFFSQTT